MKPFIYTLVMLLFLAGAPSPPSHGALVASTTLTGSTIQDIDVAGLTITVQTNGGDRYSMPVANAEIMKGLAKGDRVSLELDVQGKVVKIVKIAPDPTIAPEPKG